MKAEGYFYNATIKMLEEEPVQISPRQFDFDAYEAPTLRQMSLNLLNYRKVLGESQDSFASAIGISRPQYRKYEQGEDIMRLDVAHRISIKYGLPAFFLVANSPYQALLNLPDKDSSFDKIWSIANSLTHTYFVKLCRVLSSYVGASTEGFELTPSPAVYPNWELALIENKEYSYVAIAEGIKAVRTYYGYSQEQIADLMAVSQSTYREYEKPNQRPRFNLLVAVRWTTSTGIHPFYVLAGTELLKIRQLQNKRIAVLVDIFRGLSREELATLVPLAEGFVRASESNQKAFLLKKYA